MMTEQAGPKDLVGHVVGAEAAGFDFAVSSDHYFPWLDEMGHSPNAWVTLGAAAQATSRIPLMTYVTCPTFRYHPAVVAQQAATLQILSDGRFTLGLGAGENLNEHVVGRRLAAAPTCARRCWSRRSRSSATCSTAGYTNFRGEHFDVESAKLWDLPEKRVPIGVAVSGQAVLRDRRRAGRRDDRRRAQGRARRDVRRGRRAPASRGSGRCRSASAPTRTPRSPGRTRCSAGSVSAGRSTPSCPGRRRSTRPASSSGRGDVAGAIPCGDDVDAVARGGQGVRRRRVHPPRPGADRRRPAGAVHRVDREDADAGLAGRLRRADRGAPPWGEVTRTGDARAAAAEIISA